jgi:hypothetical protein
VSHLIARPCQAIRDKSGELRVRLSAIERRAPDLSDLVTAAMGDLMEINCRVTELESQIAALRMIGELLPVRVDLPEAEDPNQILLRLPVPMFPARPSHPAPVRDGKMAAAGDQLELEA